MIRTSFSLHRFPFLPITSPKDLYQSAQVKELLSRLSRLQAHKGVALLTGETGAGKSSVTLAWKFGLAVNQCAPITLSLPNPTPRALLRDLSRQLGLQPAHAYDSLLAQVTETLTSVRDNDKRNPIIIVEEAQNLSLEALGTLRHLADIRPDTKALITMLLVAQREFAAFLKQRVATPLRQRLLFSYHLTGLARAEMADYLNHQLERAGTARQLFEDDAVAAIFNYSQGLPRVINALAMDALYMASQTGEAMVSCPMVETAAIRREELA